MTDTTPQVVRSYLSELDAALRGLPEPVRQEILGGVTEELTGLDASAAAARIEELGDPAFIAAEARAESGVTDAAAPTHPDALWYTVIASLLVAFGGIVVPVVGWIAGIAMVWLSRAWFTWEKWVATLAAAVLAVVGALVVFGLTWVFTAGESAISLWHSSVLGLALLPGVLNIGVGLWLLWRVRRTPRP